jgi:sugar diacid utilization regulator
MATIRKRGNRYHVQIRKNGHPSITKSFSDRKTAETFAKDTESRMEHGVFQDSSLAEHTTLSDLLDRYEGDILLAKKGRYKEQHRLPLLKRELGTYTLAQIQPAHVSQYLTVHAHAQNARVFAVRIFGVEVGEDGVGFRNFFTVSP